MYLKLIPTVKWILIALGVYALISRLWACEDAYITFRYIDNWINGYGLVHNVGDRVEGFTHPVWLFLVALPTYLGVNVRASALYISLVLSLAALILIVFRDRDSQGRQVILPLGAVILLTHSGFRDFCVSGLEFPLVALLLSWLFISYKNHDLLSKPILHGTLSAFLYLTRPELALLILVFYVVYGIRIAIKLKEGHGSGALSDFTRLLQLSLPIVVIAGAYHIFRWSYYDELFPNSYYAKQGLEAYWYQGGKYLYHFFRYSPIQIAIFAAAAYFALSKRFRHLFPASLTRRVMLIQIAVLVFYVVRLGGDFMAYRFLLPPFLIAAILVNDLPNYLLLEKWKTKTLQGAIALTLIFVAFPVTAPKWAEYIADERKHYHVFDPTYRALSSEPVHHVLYELGTRLKEFQDSIDYPIVLAYTNIGYLGYAAGPNIYILDVYGLVDRQTARAWFVSPERGRPGHEVKLDRPMAVERRATIFDTGLKDWHRIMATPYGDIITLDPKFLRHFPKKLDSLRSFKHEVHDDSLDDGSRSFLSLLESSYQVDIDTLKIP